ncbi:transcriptional regulator, HxlR family [Filimonas lacunae]|uniref:Transcriptional regulator, HxlR family n=1 Tax=Filimonas lacunae TaxID=477680 RepID=A0A173MBB9_9BACT|nr:helix-turn-helix domain-containing protein [Filimonas lacunae]BAV04845.1 transcriptional regulator, HxlR family [Filimonas lacunae]SIT34675.1 transcriptional regulator, HxlR family [Filimonas lacunae]
MYIRKIPRLYNCSLEVTVEVMGGKWKPFIICYLQNGPKRPTELQKMVSGISKRVLAQQMKELEDHAIITKTVYAEVPLRTEYQLTAFGQELLPVVLMMEKWGRMYQPHLEKMRIA